MLKHTTSMYNMYVWMVRMRTGSVSPLKTWLFGLTPLSSDTTALSKSYLKLGLQIVR